MARLKRLIPVLFIKNGLIVRSEDFSYHQVIGNVINEAKRYNDWNVDELIYIDISREKFYDARRDDHAVKSFASIAEIIQAIAKVCFMPLTFGGGIRSFEDVALRVSLGADKVVLNTQAFADPGLVGQAAERFGSQCVVISVDYRLRDGRPVLFTEFGQHDTGVDVLDWVRECGRMGAGEIFLHSIDRDGAGTGFDLETIGAVADATRLPVIACGGAGMIEDFGHVLKQTKASAVAAGNIFHFTERSYPRAKKLLLKEGFSVRR